MNLLNTREILKLLQDGKQFKILLSGVSKSMVLVRTQICHFVQGPSRKLDNRMQCFTAQIEAFTENLTAALTELSSKHLNFGNKLKVQVRGF